MEPANLLCAFICHAPQSARAATMPIKWLLIEEFRRVGAEVYFSEPLDRRHGGG